MTATTTFLLICCFALNKLMQSTASQVMITVDLDIPVCTVSDQFLSIASGLGQTSRGIWKKNFTTPKMLNLAHALSPAMLRVGGKYEDALIFKSPKSMIQPNQKYKKITNYTMTTKDWDATNKFVQLAGWDFIFGLNVLLRNNGFWNSSNARDLFQYTLSKGYSVSWELGNEPDLFPEKFNTTVTPDQLARDFENLKVLLYDIPLLTKYIAGPDTGTKDSYLSSFLSKVKPGLLNAVTWHHYYLSGKTAVLSDMFNVTVLDKFIEKAKQVKGNINQYLPDTELWLGETSSCYGGGAPNLSGSFVSGFMWLDKLGVAALTNHSRVFRQEFIGGAYGLLDRNHNPLPDYWLSVLYKKLVGERVLNVSGGLELGRHIRAYAHCARQPLNKPGDIVLFILNTNSSDTTALVNIDSLKSAPREVYWLSPPDNNILNREVALNGKVLSLVDGTTLPDLSPLHQDPTETINLPALTFGFYVFKDVNAKACL